jgi:hypothetical protein
VAKLKNLKIPENIYTDLTKFKGELTSDSGKNCSYGDAISHLLESQKAKKK